MGNTFTCKNNKDKLPLIVESKTVKTAKCYDKKIKSLEQIGMR